MQTTIAPTPTNGSVQKTNGVQKNKAINDDVPAFFVYQTTDYQKFKIMADNRNINMIHVKRLIDSFNAKHLVSPIIVNEIFEVIDGQHRLSAAMETGKPIHYIIVEGYDIEEVQILNTNQKNWNKSDYLQSYCAEGKKHYLEFKEFMDYFPDFGIQVCERLLTGYAKGKTEKFDGQTITARDFENGKLFIPNLGKSYQIARRCLEFKPFFYGYNRSTFISAVLHLFGSKHYNHKEMLKKLGSTPIKLELQADVEKYLHNFEKIYNYKRVRENQVSFKYHS